MEDAVENANVLKTLGVMQRSSTRQKEVLGCIACRWNRSDDEAAPRTYGYEIMKCRQMAPGSLYPILNRLEEAGVFAVETEQIGEGNHGRPPRRYVTPGLSELAVAFRAALTVPEECPLTQA